MLFIILSNQPFDFKLKTNKWHIACQMAKKGHKVIFLDPPLRFKALKNLNRVVEKKSNNLIVYRPINLFNFFPFSFFNTFIHLQVCKSLIKKMAAQNEKKVLYIYHFDFPDLRNFFKKIPFSTSVYDCVDIYREFPQYSNNPKLSFNIVSLIQSFDDFLKIRLNQNGLSLQEWVDDQEKWLCKNCDLVFASAPGVVTHLNKFRADIHYLPNGVEYNAFVNAKKLAVPQDLKNIPHPIIGLTGAIDNYKRNIKLIEKCATTYPKYHFVLIGPEKLEDKSTDLSILKKMNNVHFLGEKPWAETPAYFGHFDVYFIPDQINAYTIGSHPIKYFEALAAGLPTLITLSSVKAFDIDGFVTADENQFIKNIEIAIRTDSVKKQKARQALAKGYTWESKADKILGLISGLDR